MPPVIPPANSLPSPEGKKPRSSAWNRLQARASATANIVALFAFILVAGAAVGYFYAQSRKPATPAKTPAIQTLSQSDINKLSEIGSNLGTTGQTLNIGANALFRGKADITGDLSIGGHLNANGPVTLSQLNITGTTAATGLNVGSNLNVTGTTTLQQSLTVNNLTTINSNLTVTGSLSAGALNAGSIAVRTITISGPLTIAHLATQGSAPTIAADNPGAGGTVSISGNDTAGTVNVNTGTNPGGALATITFRAAFGATVHVQITPLTSAAAISQSFVTRTATSFQVHAASPPPGATLSFDYLVVQ